MLRSHTPVMLEGACTSAPASDWGAGGAEVAVVVSGWVGGVDAGAGSCGVVGGGFAGAPNVETGVASSAGQPYRDASAVARSPPARCQPTIASTRLLASASPYSTTGSSADTVAAMPTLRS